MLPAVQRQGLSCPAQIAKTVMSGGRLEIPSTSQLESRGGGFASLGLYVDLIQQCWAQNPDERPGFAEVISRLR